MLWLENQLKIIKLYYFLVKAIFSQSFKKKISDKIDNIITEVIYEKTIGEKMN